MSILDELDEYIQDVFEGVIGFEMREMKPDDKEALEFDDDSLCEGMLYEVSKDGNSFCVVKFVKKNMTPQKAGVDFSESVQKSPDKYRAFVLASRPEKRSKDDYRVFIDQRLLPLGLSSVEEV